MNYCILPIHLVMLAGLAETFHRSHPRQITIQATLLHLFLSAAGPTIDWIARQIEPRRLGGDRISIGIVDCIVSMEWLAGRPVGGRVYSISWVEGGNAAHRISVFSQYILLYLVWN